MIAGVIDLTPATQALIAAVSDRMRWAVTITTATTQPANELHTSATKEFPARIASNNPAGAPDARSDSRPVTTSPTTVPTITTLIGMTALNHRSGTFSAEVISVSILEIGTAPGLSSNPSFLALRSAVSIGPKSRPVMAIKRPKKRVMIG